MVKINPSPDTRYGVTLSNGVSKMGARKGILDFAIRAARDGITVVAWIVPGKLKVKRHNSAELLNGEYQRQILLLRPKD
jgi:hypothetical protein